MLDFSLLLSSEVIHNLMDPHSVEISATQSSVIVSVVSYLLLTLMCHIQEYLNKIIRNSIKNDLLNRFQLYGIIVILSKLVLSLRLVEA